MDYEEDDLDQLIEEIDFDEEIDMIGVEDVADSDVEQEPCVVDEDTVADCFDNDDDSSEEETKLQKLPKIVFVSDENIHTIASYSDASTLVGVVGAVRRKDEQQSVSSSPITFQCKKCNKIYKRAAFLKKHQALCKAIKKKKKSAPAAVKQRKIDVIDEEYMKCGSDWLKDALQKAVDDVYFNMLEPGISVGNLSRHILSCMMEQPVISSISQSLCKLLYPLVAVSKLTNEDRDKMFNQFYNICMHESNIKLWNDFLTEFDIENNNISLTLFQFILDIMFKNGITYYAEKLRIQHTFDEDSIRLDDDEQQSLRYVAGYVAYSLQKSFKKSNSPDAKILLKLSLLWGANDDADKDARLTFLDYTKTWVDTINRGGLFQINNQFFILIRCIENVARSILNLNLIITYCGDDLRKILLEKFGKSSLIQEAWDRLVNKMGNKELAAKLLHKIFNKWINIRIHAFVNVWIQTMKRKLSYEKDKKKKKKKVSEKGEPALRKTLTSRKKSTISEKGEPSLRKSISKKKD